MTRSSLLLLIGELQFLRDHIPTLTIHPSPNYRTSVQTLSLKKGRFYKENTNGSMASPCCVCVSAWWEEEMFGSVCFQ